MSCSSGRCSSSSTAACQVMGVIDLLFFRNGRIPEEEEVAQKMAQNFMGYFFAAHCRLYLHLLKSYVLYEAVEA